MRASGLIILITILAAMTVPASAADYTFTGHPVLYDYQEFKDLQNYDFDVSDQGKAIFEVDFSTESGSYTNFTIYYGNGETVTGSVQNNLISLIPPTTTAWITLNGVTSSYTYWDATPTYDFNIAGYAMDDTNQTGIIVYHAGYGTYDDDLAVFFPVTGAASKPIYRIVLSTPSHFSGNVKYADVQTVTKTIDKGWVESFVDTVTEYGSLIAQYGTLLWGIFLAVIYWLKFLFVDHLMLTVTMYVMGSLWYCIAYSASIMKGLRKWLGMQEKFLRFIIEMFNTAITMISNFINSLKPI